MTCSGPKPLFVPGLVVFTLASAACGLASTPDQLIVFRVIQGVGGALLTPQTLSTITVIFPPDKRGVAFGVWGAVAGVATIAGPTLGGYLVTDFGWEWIFYVNVPVGMLTVMLALVAMPDLRLNRRHRLDWTGTGPPPSACSCWSTASSRASRTTGAGSGDRSRSSR